MAELDLVVSSFHTTVLVSLSKQLGCSPDALLAEAIEDYITIVAPARVEEVSQIEKSSNVIQLRMRKTG